MKITYGPGATPEWWASLSRFQRHYLAATHRQGKHLADRTDHGPDHRWMQAGCVTYERRYRGHYARFVKPNDIHAHERVVVVPTDYGFELLGIRRSIVYVVDEETGASTPIEGWTGVWVWYVKADSAQSWPPSQDDGEGGRRRPEPDPWANRRVAA
jgi:hypothetical protein